MSPLRSTTAPRGPRRTAAALATAAVALGLAVAPGVAVAAVPDAADTTVVAPDDAPRGAIPVVGGSTRLTTTPQMLERLREHGLRLVRVDDKARTREAVPTNAPFNLTVTSGVVTNMDGRIGGRVLYEDRALAVVNTKTRQMVRLADFQSDMTRNAVRASVNQADSMAIGSARSPRISRETLNVAEREVQLEAHVRLTERAAERLNQLIETDAFDEGIVFAQTNSRFNLDEDQDVRTALGLDRDLKTTPRAQDTRQDTARDRDTGRAEDELATEENLTEAFPNAVAEPFPSRPEATGSAPQPLAPTARPARDESHTDTTGRVAAGLGAFAVGRPARAGTIRCRVERPRRQRGHPRTRGDHAGCAWWARA